MNRHLTIKDHINDPVYSTTYALMTDQQVLDAMNAKTIPVKQDIATRDIQKYLALQSKLLPLEASVDPAALNAVRMMELFSSFSMDEPDVEIALTASLTALVNIGDTTIFESTDKDAILAMGVKNISIIDQLGLGTVAIGEIADARA